MAKYSPMMRQYLDIKAKHEDAILFFRLGDFYEMFMEDAEEVARLLGLALTGREAGPAGRVPMCGVPHHAADTYIAKLITLGKKVAICEQVELPSQAKGLVKREVVRIVTPGSLLEGAMLEDDRANYLASIKRSAKGYGLSLIELSTGEVLADSYPGRQLPSRLTDDILKFLPVELIINIDLNLDKDLQRLARLAGINTCTTLSDQAFSWEQAQAQYGRQYGQGTTHGLPQLAFEALGAALLYLQKTQQNSLPHLRSPRCINTPSYMELDATTLRNLELLRSADIERGGGSLLSVLDETTTALGARQLRQWIAKPLYNKEGIEKRLDAVAELAEENLVRDHLRQLLKKCYDLERLAGRVATNVASPRDLEALKQSLGLLPDLGTLLENLESPACKEAADRILLLPELKQELEDALARDLPTGIREGGIFADGYNEQLDELRYATQHGKEWLAQLEADERDKTGIKSLKVGFNRVFGYYIEVTRTNTHMVPKHYIRKQTLVNAERYITEDLKAKEDAILGGEEKQRNFEYELFLSLRRRVAEFVAQIQQNASLVAELDCLQSLATAAIHNRFVRPHIDDDGRLEIVEGRHPVVEQVIGRHQFVPNDITMDAGEILVITGPNMGGKSTYMRQVALIILMAQMGSFVPAMSAHISLVDRVFTRVGAADDLFSGKSTFMVEMIESQVALSQATPNSLIVFDELGRGTSTFDGMALAWAIIEYVQHQIGCKTLFSTHYHELTNLAESLPKVRNVSCQVIEEKGELIFLHKVAAGRADRSYGLNVAKMAGLPTAVLRRARQMLSRIEQRTPAEVGALQLTFGDFMLGEANMDSAAASETLDPVHKQIFEELEAKDLNTLTPLDALNLIAAWQKLQREGGQ